MAGNESFEVSHKLVVYVHTHTHTASGSSQTVASLPSFHFHLHLAIRSHVASKSSPSGFSLFLLCSPPTFWASGGDGDENALGQVYKTNIFRSKKSALVFDINPACVDGAPRRFGRPACCVSNGVAAHVSTRSHTHTHTLAFFPILPHSYPPTPSRQIPGAAVLYPDGHRLRLSRLPRPLQRHCPRRRPVCPRVCLALSFCLSVCFPFPLSLFPFKLDFERVPCPLSSLCACL